MTQTAASWRAGMRKAVLDRQRPSLHPCFPPLLLLPTSFETMRLSQRDFKVEALERGPLHPSLLFTMYDLQHIMPQHTRHPRPPVHQSRRERLTHVCIASSVTTIGLGSFGIYGLASFKRAAKKLSLCRINLFLSLFCFFLSQKTTNN